MKKSLWLALALIVLPGLAPFAPAEAGPRPPRAGWRGDIRRFHEHDLQVWRRGRWHYGRHAGRAGWWWIVGGLWYWYPARVYPYPDPYTPPIVIQTAPSVQPQPQTPTWYYCDNPAGYYPYVPECPSGWKAVPAYPPPAPPPSASTPPPPQTRAQTPVWYYCENPAGYYPAVSECPGGWKMIPATPPTPPSAPAPAPPSNR